MKLPVLIMMNTKRDFRKGGWFKKNKKIYTLVN